MIQHTTHEHRLPNGLLVLTREVHAAPIATCWLWYRVGARSERPGSTGLSHWVEHMLFNGTPTLDKHQLERQIERNGGSINAFTSYDFTAYYTQLPADRIELALRIESDRMLNASFSPDEVERERTVILAELDGYTNYPTTWLEDAFRSAAYTTHAYRQPIIGYRHDLQAITRDELYTHYQTYYMPNNAVLVLVGDFQTDGMLTLVERNFADLPTGLPIPPLRLHEPEPHGERRVTVERPGVADYVQIGFNTPDCHHSDFAALTVLDAILSGPGALLGSGVSGTRSARLYPALVLRGLASSAYSSYRPTIDPTLFELQATVQHGHTAAEIEAALLHEVERIQQDGITADELTRVLRQIRAQVAYGSESVSTQAYLLGAWEVLDRYSRLDTLLDELQAVTPTAVQAAAQHYLTPRRRTVGHYRATPPTTADEATMLAAVAAQGAGMEPDHA